MGRRSTSLWLLAILFIGLAIGYMIPSQTSILALQQKVERLEEQLADREVEIVSLRLRISDIERRLETRILGAYFSPRGGCADQIIGWIDRANTSIRVLIYSFTLNSVGEALRMAHSRGVDVRIVFEKSKIDRYSEYQTLRSAGIDIRNDTNPQLMHHKVMIVDDLIVLTGSFNWSMNAEENNNENLIVTTGKYTAEIYSKEFEEIWEESIWG